MSFQYSIRNLQNCADLKTKRKEFFDLLRLQQRLNSRYEQAMISRSQIEKLGITPVPTAPRSLEDERKDLVLQQQLAIKNVSTIMKPEDAQKAVNSLSTGEIYSLNSEWGRLSKLIQGRTNITPDFLRHVFQRYLLEIERSGGLAVGIPLQESTLSRLPADLVDEWQNWSRQTIDPLTNQLTSLTTLIQQTADLLNRPVEEVRQEVEQVQAELKPSPVEEPERPPPPSRPTGRSTVRRGVAPRRSVAISEEQFVPASGLPTPPELPSNAEIRKMKVADMRALLEALGQDSEGVRKVLEPRLLALKAQMATRQESAMDMEELRRQLQILGAPTEGTKRELIDRLESLGQPRVPIQRRTFLTPEEVPPPRMPFPPPPQEMEEGTGLYMGARPMLEYAGTRSSYRTVGGSGNMEYNKTTKFVRRNGKILGKVGSGIKPNKENETYSRYREFGRYFLHVPSLAKCLMNIKYPSRIAIAEIPPRFVSQPFISMVEKILDTGIWDKGEFNKLSEEEQDYFITLARKCEFDTTIGMGIRLTKKESKDYERFELLKGTVVAGNNSPEVLTELKSYILRFLNDGRLPKRVGHDLLYEISCL